MKFAKQLHQRLSPPSFELSAKDQQLLQQIYPKIDWAYVRFFDGLPWFITGETTLGTALPNSNNGAYINVYLKNYEQMSVYSQLSILVHESFHINQYQELNSMGKNTSGWGFNRRFMRYYLGWYLQALYTGLFKDKQPFKKAARQAYRQHPMEIPAYSQEEHFQKKIDLYKQSSVDSFFEQAPELIIEKPLLIEKPSVFFHSLGSISAFVISLLKPCLEIIFLFPTAYIFKEKKETKQG